MSNSRSGKYFSVFNLTRSTPLFLRGDLRCKREVLSSAALNLQLDNLCK